MGPTVTSVLQAGSRRLSDGDKIGLIERSATPVSIPPYDETYTSRCSEVFCEPSHVSERRSASDDVEARLREAFTRTPIRPATHPEIRLSHQLEASVPQETVERPYEQDSTQDYQCGDVSTQGFFDLETDWFAPTDTIQPNPISSAQSLSPHEDQRHADTAIVSNYGSTWNDPGFGDPVVVDVDQESDSSGSDVLRFPRRTRTKRHCNDALASPSISPQPSQASGRSKRRPRLRRRQAGVEQSPSPPTAYVVIPPAPKHLTSLSFSTPARHHPVTFLASSRVVDSKIQMVVELPTSVFGNIIGSSVGSRDNTALPRSDVVARSRYSARENTLLAQLKRQRKPRLTWKMIQAYFPDRTLGALQVHYYTHLRSRRQGK